MKEIRYLIITHQPSSDPHRTIKGGGGEGGVRFLSSGLRTIIGPACGHKMLRIVLRIITVN